MKTLIPIISIAVPIAGCGTLGEIHIQKDKKADFSVYKTFAWLPDKEMGEKTFFKNDFIRQRNKNYFGHCMAQWEIKLDTLNPDLLLSIDWLSHVEELELTRPRELPDYYDLFYYGAPTLLLYSRGFQFKSGRSATNPDRDVVELEHGWQDLP